MASPVEKITKMFMKTVEMMENSTNDLVRYLVKRSHVFANTVIACNRTIIEREDVNAKYCLNDNEMTDVSVIKECFLGIFLFCPN